MKARVVFLALLLAATAGMTNAQEAELLSEVADGLLELQGESSIELSGVVGTFSIRLGKGGEIRYASRLRENRRTTIPVELWLDGNALILTAPEDSADTARLIEITVPPEMLVRVEAGGSVVRVNGIRGDLEIVGDELDIDARGVIGNVMLDLHSSKAVLVGTDRALELEVEDTDLRIDQATGPLRLTQRKGRSEIIQLLGDIQMDVDEGLVSGNHVEGVLELVANRTSLDWIQVRGGGTLRLTESPLVLSESQGVVEIDTDASVEFRSARGPLRIRGFGAGVRGTGATAMVEIDTSDAGVSLDSMSGPVVVKGRGLEVSIRQSKNSVKLDTESSTAVLEEIGGAIEIRNDYGDLKVVSANQAVQIDSTAGMVEVSKLRAPIQLRADGPEVSVDWAEMTGDQDSNIENPGGTVSLRIPQGAGGCTVEAVSEYGQIDSQIPGVPLDGGASRANVVIRAPKPKVKVNAGGDVRLSLGDVARTPRPNRPAVQRRN